MCSFMFTDGQDANDLCADLPSMYPDSLIQLPERVDPRGQNPTIQPSTTSAATFVQPAGLLALILAVMALF